VPDPEGVRVLKGTCWSLGAADAGGVGAGASGAAGAAAAERE